MMDWHKLQHTLFALDPTDPREDLAKLQGSASQPQESVVSTKDYVQESVEVAEGSLGLDKDYSVADFAALAGVSLNESQKTGSAGQLKGKDKVKSIPAGSTKNVTRDKLVGEGPMDAVKQGFSNYNNIGAFNKDSMGSNKPTPAQAPQKKEPTKVKGGVSAAQLGKQLGVDDPQIFAQAVLKIKAGQSLNRAQHESLSGAFQKLMAMDPQSTNKAMMLLKRIEASESVETNKEVDSVKSRLWAALDAKK